MVLQFPSISRIAFRHHDSCPLTPPGERIPVVVCLSTLRVGFDHAAIVDEVTQEFTQR